MHELAIAQSILDTVLETAAEHQASRVGAIHLRIGELCQVVRSTLEEGFAILATGTVAESAELRIDWVPTVWRCNACGQTRSVDRGPDQCPCGAATTEDRLEGSDDLVLTSMELDTPDDEPSAEPSPRGSAGDQQ